MTLQRRLAARGDALPDPARPALAGRGPCLRGHDSYVASLLAKDPPVAPLDRLAREAAHGARTGHAGQATRTGRCRGPERPCARPLFRFELVMRINVVGARAPRS